MFQEPQPSISHSATPSGNGKVIAWLTDTLYKLQGQGQCTQTPVSSTPTIAADSVSSTPTIAVNSFHSHHRCLLIDIAEFVNHAGIIIHITE